MTFFAACVTGVAPDGTPMPFVIAASWINSNIVRGQEMPPGLPPLTPGGPVFTNPLERLAESWGSTRNHDIMTLLDRPTNILKGAFLGLTVPISANSFHIKVLNHIYDSVGPDPKAAEWLSWLQKVSKDVSCMFF